MSQNSILKISGQKFEIPKNVIPSGEAWKFEFRPGGWVIASRATSNGSTERVRFYYRRDRDQVWGKIGTDFYGQKTEPSRGNSAGSGGSDFTAQFPGKVRKILVANGTAVEAHTPILMVEAMKMEFAIKAEVAGTVKKILVTEGQQLTPGQKLVDFEEKP